MAEAMQVEVVSADRVVWSGLSHNVIAMTVDGEIGVLPGHAPILGVLVPGVVVVFTEDNNQRERVAVDGGFISVSQGRVSILSEYAEVAEEISASAAERELEAARNALDTGDGTEDDRKRLRRATAQVRAAQKTP